MKITGQILKEARESQNLSLSEISMSTKVSQKMLRAIEEGDLSQLPAKTFLRGFVQAYAIALKLDVDHIMNTFLEEMGTTTPEVAEAEEMAAQVISGRTLPSSWESSTTVKVAAVAGIVVLIFVVLGVKNLVEKYEAESRLEPVPETIESLAPRPEPTPAEPEKAQAAVDNPAEEVSSENSNASANEKAEVSPPASPTESAPAEPEKPETQPITSNPTAEAPAAPPPAASAVAEAPAPAPTEPEVAVQEKPKPAASGGTSKEVILEALDRIEVAVKVGDEALKKIVLQPDEVHTLKGRGRIILDLSDGGAVNLIVNGSDRGVPGDLGKPKKVEIP